MEGLRWWLVLLTAVMFSMAGCAMTGASISGKTVHAPVREEWWHRPAPEVGGVAFADVVLERSPQ
jgi:hypothetical protein